MQLVELETEGGSKLWINPQHVVRLSPDRNAKDRTHLYVLGSAQEFLEVKGDIARVAEIINGGMRPPAVEAPRPTRLSSGLTPPK